jgi:hypothetical protein
MSTSERKVRIKKSLTTGEQIMQVESHVLHKTRMSVGSLV